MYLVEFASVTKRYQLGDVEVVALDGVDFHVQPGDFVAITGPSGSGKTTMLNLIGRLDSPSDGEVRVMGKAVNALGEPALDQLRSRTFGMIFQNFNLIPVLTAEENVALPLHLHALSRQEARQRVAERCARWAWSASPASARTSFPAVSVSGWRWRARW